MSCQLARRTSVGAGKGGRGGEGRGGEGRYAFSPATYDIHILKGSPALFEYLGKSQDFLGYHFQILQVGEVLCQVVIVVSPVSPEAGPLCVDRRRREERRRRRNDMDIWKRVGGEGGRRGG